MPECAFVYDDLGRVRSVADAAGEVAIYSYDVVGNLLSIERLSPSALSIIEFTPKQGTVGTSVTIQGTRMSAGAVTFNGVPATVINAIPTRIVVVVPPGAVSGPIVVTTPDGSATSASPFTVTDAATTPTITGISPGIGTPDAAVSITGTNFDTILANNTVTFNRALARIVSVSETTMQAEVSPGATSGRITVRTPAGSAVSNEDFFVPPPPRTEVDVGFTGRIAQGDSKRVTVDTPGKIALVVFEGAAGERMSVGVSEIGIEGGTGVIEISILPPHGPVLASKLVARLGDDIDMEPLPESGTHTIVIDAGAATVGCDLTLSRPVAGSLEVGDPPLAVSIDVPWQDARVTFDGAAAQRVDLGVSEVNFGGASGAMTVSILHPDGTTLASRVVSLSGRGLHPDPLADSGAYTIVVDPADARAVTFALTLSEPFTGTLTVEGASVPVTLRPGQTARLVFEATAGQRISLGVSEVRFGTGNHVVITVVKPDGTTLLSRILGTNGGVIDFDPLPDTGTYTIVADPQASSLNPGATTASLTVTLAGR